MDLNHVPIGSIQRILGHENRTTTEIYLHRIGDPERKAMEVFERVNRDVARVPEGDRGGEQFGTRSKAAGSHAKPHRVKVYG